MSEVGILSCEISFATVVQAFRNHTFYTKSRSNITASFHFTDTAQLLSCVQGTFRLRWSVNVTTVGQSLPPHSRYCCRIAPWQMSGTTISVTVTIAWTVCFVVFWAFVCRETVCMSVSMMHACSVVFLVVCLCRCKSHLFMCVLISSGLSVICHWATE